MKFCTYTTLLCLLLLYANVNGQRNCGSTEYLQDQIKNQPDRARILQEIEKHTQNFLRSSDNLREVITIPVVVHVVYNNSTENISDAQVQSQIQVLNDDFRRLNADANNTWSQATDVEIQFCLATVDPNGNITSGITRTSTSRSSFGTNDEMKFDSNGGKDAWPASEYMNIWVCDISGGVLGYAQFPGGPASTDGIVIDYKYFGNVGTATAPFNLGRTGTHEVGHYLNLRHIWGDGACGQDDFVNDTPLSDAPNYGCATGHVSCGSADMIENYMDYSDDACMNLFTAGQKTRMRALFSEGGSRYSLTLSNGCGQGSQPTCSDGFQNGLETGVDCGGPDCVPCQSSCSGNEVTVTINFDSYPEETSWIIRDAEGQTIASGGTYGSQPDGSTVIQDLCLVDGCYDFVISDAYGDGICCAYGNGSYKVAIDTIILAQGGAFGSSEVTNFCLDEGTFPTCSDGIQNGQETGIDCGGPECPACPTCSDGIQNGQETGIDCGGPECAACLTCSDGIQNGQETGIDCGGPDCDPCIITGSENVFGHYYETGFDGWTDGGSDCSRYRGTRSYEGQYSIRIRDNSGTRSSMTSPVVDLVAFNSIEFKFVFYPYSMENGEDFWVLYNDGNGWQTVATFVQGTDFNNNNFYSATVMLEGSQYNLSNSSNFRIQCDASSNADAVYVDAVELTGYFGARMASSGKYIEQLPKSVVRNGAEFNMDTQFDLTPNPASNKILISSEDEFNSVSVFDISGKLLKRMANPQRKEMQINISDLSPGLYLISLETEDELLTERFIKQ